MSDFLNQNNFFSRVQTVQDLISKDIFEDNSNDKHDMIEVLSFIRDNGVPLTDDQVQSWLLLNEFGLSDIALYMNAVRPMLTPTKLYFDMVNKITLADRIKGTAKLDKLLKASVANPSSQVSPADLQPKALKEKELGGRV
jgi:hypothetical protein